MKIDFKYAKGLYTNEEMLDAKKEVLASKKILDSKTGAGNDYLGWLTLPSDYLKSDELNKVLVASEKIKKESDVLVVLGIGFISWS